MLLTPGLRPEPAQAQQQAKAVEALDAIDPIEPVASQPGALDFLKQPRDSGKRVPAIKSFCYTEKPAAESLTSTGPESLGLGEVRPPMLTSPTVRPLGSVTALTTADLQSPNKTQARETEKRSQMGSSQTNELLAD